MFASHGSRKTPGFGQVRSHPAAAARDAPYLAALRHALGGAHHTAAHDAGAAFAHAIAGDASAGVGRSSLAPSLHGKQTVSCTAASIQASALVGAREPAPVAPDMIPTSFPTVQRTTDALQAAVAALPAHRRPGGIIAMPEAGMLPLGEVHTAAERTAHTYAQADNRMRSLAYSAMDAARGGH